MTTRTPGEAWILAYIALAALVWVVVATATVLWPSMVAFAVTSALSFAIAVAVLGWWTLR